MGSVGTDISSRVPEGHHPTSARLSEEICLSEGSAGVSPRVPRGLSEGSAGLWGVRVIFRGFSGVVTLCL